MGRHDDELRKSLKKRPASAEYEVGYRKPPLHSRFKRGQSGNPSGRPKGRKNRPKVGPSNEEPLKEIILKEAYREITVTESNRQVSMPMMQAIVRSQAVNAARGNLRAQREFTGLVTLTERDNKRRHTELLQAAVEYKIDWEIELERRKALSIDGPEPLPHPDHIIIEPVTGDVHIIGPMTKEEKARWDWLRERKRASDDEIALMEKMLEEDPDCPYRDFLIENMEREKKIRKMLSKVIPD
jgi:hypothetical protein